LVARLHDVVDSQTFFDTAEAVLTQISSSTDLARCAELVGRREPGGAYYRAKFWARSERIRSQSENGYPRKTLGLLSIEAGVNYYVAKSYIAQGQALESAAAESAQAEAEGRAFVDTRNLREAPAAIFQYALSQKERASEYLIEAASILEENPRITAVAIHNRWCQENGGIKANLDIIKPSDWWAFSHPKWRKEDDFPGSIPGEVVSIPGEKCTTLRVKSAHFAGSIMHTFSVSRAERLFRIGKVIVSISSFSTPPSGMFCLRPLGYIGSEQRIGFSAICVQVDIADQVPKRFIGTLPQEFRWKHALTGFHRVLKSGV
jgi:hypothetical protein